MTALRAVRQQEDFETGLDFFGARYFSGAQGRFTSPDKPLADQHPEDPQSWNYVTNNPLRYLDQNGRAKIEILYNRIGPGYTLVRCRNGQKWGSDVLQGWSNGWSFVTRTLSSVL